jgi:hypothetical protein
VAGEDGQRTKAVRVASKDKGGIGEAKAELGHFAASLAEGTPAERPTVTVAENARRVCGALPTDRPNSIDR